MFDVRNAVSGAAGDLDNLSDLMLQLAESGAGVTRESMYGLMKAVGAIRDDIGKAEAMLAAMGQRPQLKPAA